MTLHGTPGGPRRLPAIAFTALALAAAVFTATAVWGADESKAQAPQTLKKSVWGPQTHNGTSLFPYYRDLGMGLFQLQVRWDQAAMTRPANPTDPNDPAYTWPAYIQDTINEAQANGMEVAIQLIAAPGWSNAGQAFNYPATNPADFGNFATAISRKYPAVRHWIVWGEPNRKVAFGPVVNAPQTANTKLNKKQARAPKLYAQMLDAAYNGLKGVSGGNLVIGGNTYLSSGKPVIRPYQWIRYMRLPNGSRPRMDMWGHNPYNFRTPNLKNPPSPRGRVDFSDLGRLLKTLNKTFKGQKLKLFLSEWGVPIGRDQDLEFGVKAKKAKKWVRAAMRIVRKNRRIYTLGWVIFVDTERNPQGLLDRGLNPKPTYGPFKNG